MAAKSHYELQSPDLLTHITLLGEPIEEPGGEMDASDRRLCCGLESEKGGVHSHSEEVSYFMQTFHS